MLKGTRVQWTTAAGVHGSGTIISDSEVIGFNPPHVFVAVDALPGEERRVIWCAETWLTVVEPSNG